MTAPSGLEPMEWTVRVPLLTNRVILKQMVWWAGLTALLCGAIFGGILMSEDGLEALPTVLVIMAAIFGALIVLAVLVMGLFFFNRMTLRFHVDADGISMATGDAKVRAANTAAIVLGALAGKPGAVGAGLAGRSQEKDSVDWSDIKRWRTLPDLHAVAAHRGFPGPLYVYAPADRYQALLDRFAAMRPAQKT
jgi:uncharacterized membrane protein